MENCELDQQLYSLADIQVPYLTLIQLQTYKDIADGLSSVEAGLLRGRAPKTIKNSRAILMDKVPANHKAHLVSIGYQTRILQIDEQPAWLKPAELSSAEDHILKLTALGYSRQQIAVTRFTAYITVRNHCNSIRGKFDAPNMAYAVSRAYEIGNLAIRQPAVQELPEISIRPSN